MAASFASRVGRGIDAVLIPYGKNFNSVNLFDLSRIPLIESLPEIKLF